MKSLKFKLLLSTAVFFGATQVHAQPLVVGNGSGTYGGTVNDILKNGPTAGQAQDPASGLYLVPGQLASTAGTPTFSSGSCGSNTNMTIVAGSTNQTGQIIIGSQAATSCIMNWSATLGAAPEACVFFPTNATAATAATLGRTTAPSTTSGTLLGAVLASTSWAYLCM